MTDTLTRPPETDFLDKVSDALVSYQDPPVTWEKQRAAKDTRVDDLERTLVGDSEREKAFQEFASQIDSYRYLEHNWDTYGGLPASEQAIRFSIRLLKELQIRAEISPPYVCPISTGVYIEWRSGDANLYFEVDEDSVLFAARKGERELECGEHMFFDVNEAVEQAVELVERFHQNAI